MVTCVYTLVTKTLQIYINGVLDTQTTGVSTPNEAIVTPLYIGADTQGGYFFSGAMDDVRIYNTPLSPSDISNLYTAQN